LNYITEILAFYDWIESKPDFAAEYKRRKRQAVSEASDYLQSRISAATRIIDEIMNDADTPSQVRLNAAKVSYFTELLSSVLGNYFGI
jgi:hypothetical protein